MAITRIRGGQIHDRTIEGIKIAQGALLNEHIADNAAIHESKLDINWANHATEILSGKKVVDYVQVNGSAVGGVDKYVVTEIPGTAAFTNSDPLSAEGIIVDAPKNKVPLRDALTGDPVLDADGREVFGRLTFNATDSKYELSFFVNDAGTEVPFTMPSGQVIDWQFAQRFNLQTVNEMFAANEKFVEGTADATAHLNIEQLAKDLYGSTFSLDRDGNANLTKSLVEQLADEVARATAAETALQNAIAAEEAARIAADESIVNDLSSNDTGKGASLIGIEDAAGKFAATTVEGALAELKGDIDAANTGAQTKVDDLKSDLASTAAGKGASLIGVEDAGGNFSATNLEGVLAEIDARIDQVEQTGGAEVTAARTSDITGTHASLDARIEAAEARYEAVKTEVEAARGAFADLDERFADVEGKVAQEVTDRQAADTALQGNIDAEVTRAQAAEAALQTAIDNETTRAQAAEGALQTNIDNVNDALDTYKTANDARVAAVEAKNVEQDARLDAIEAAGTGNSSDIAAIQAEIQDARGSKASIDERLDVALNEDGTLKVANQIHEHKKIINQIISNTNVINMPPGEFFRTDGTLDIYVNGILQANGVNFTEVTDVDGKGIGVDFGADQLLVGDVVIIEYVKYFV